MLVLDAEVVVLANHGWDRAIWDPSRHALPFWWDVPGRGADLRRGGLVLVLVLATLE